MSVDPRRGVEQKELQMIIVKEDFFKADLANLIAKGTKSYQWNYRHKSDMEIRS